MSEPGEPAAHEYGDRWAGIYDAYPAHPSEQDAQPAADLLVPLADGGAALEFGIGTGRMALALAARGVTVCGIDASAAMLDQLARKPGGDTIQVITGDITTTRVDGVFGLVYAVFNTLLMVLTQDGQVECFHNAATHLSPGGHFVVETFIPEFTKLAGTGADLVRSIDDDGAWILRTRHDALARLIHSDAIRIGSGGTQRYPTVLRYLWPAELDLMARLAGFRLVARYGDWRRAPLTVESRNQVSVYRLG
jgi:SAM-dependent methyltransferase